MLVSEEDEDIWAESEGETDLRAREVCGGWVGESW